MRVEWSSEARFQVRQYIRDQDGMRALNEAVAALADDPSPPGAFVRGDYRRLRVGRYRVMYRVRGDEVTVYQVDFVL